jgi:Ca2+-binding RTX toxin-like protein
MTTISLASLGTAYTQNFDTLSNIGAANILSIPGWALTEDGGGVRDDEQYAADTGASSTGDTYSYGATGSVDRALGALRAVTLTTTFGAFFVNDTGSTIKSLTISYGGEQWRLGTAGRTDQLDFQYSTNATDLTTGTWTDKNELDFITPDALTVGAKNGNAAPDRTTVAAIISGLNIAPGQSFAIRWNDIDATGADDGLAVDDFSLIPRGVPSMPFISSIVDHGSLFAVSGGAEIGNTVTISDSNGAVAAFSTTANGSGGYTASSASALVDGSHAFTAVATDAASNSSAPSTPVHVVIQTANHLAFSDVSFTIGEDSTLTHLVLEGSGLTGTGNSLGSTIFSIEGSTSDVNTLVGGLGNDILVGGIGADYLQGGGGKDIFVVYNSATEIVAGGPIAGHDGIVYAEGVSYNLQLSGGFLGGVGALILEGGTGLTGSGYAFFGTSLYSLSTAGQSNTLIGGAEGDLLVGGLGADNLQGGGGNDVYVVHSTATTVFDSGAGRVGHVSIDIVYAEGLNWSLNDGDGIDALLVENGTDLTATGHATEATRLYSVDSSIGNSNTLIGGSGNDALVGGIGADHLHGGGGNDVYAVYNSGTEITDSGGTDVAYAYGVNYQIADGSGIDALVVVGSGLIGTGSAGNDALYSVGNGNTLSGGSAGSDNFFFDATTTGANRITGFQPHGASESGGLIVLQNYSDTSFANAVANHHIYQSGNDVIVADASHFIVTLQNTSLADLHANDFYLA